MTGFAAERSPSAIMTDDRGVANAVARSEEAQRAKAIAQSCEVSSQTPRTVESGSVVDNSWRHRGSVRAL